MTHSSNTFVLPFFFFFSFSLLLYLDVIGCLLVVVVVVVLQLVGWGLISYVQSLDLSLNLCVGFVFRGGVINHSFLSRWRLSR